MAPWDAFERALERRAAAFESVRHCTDRLALLRSIGIEDPIIQGAIETEWIARLDEEVRGDSGAAAFTNDANLFGGGVGAGGAPLLHSPDDVDDLPEEELLTAIGADLALVFLGLPAVLLTSSRVATRVSVDIRDCSRRSSLASSLSSSDADMDLDSQRERRAQPVQESRVWRVHRKCPLSCRPLYEAAARTSMQLSTLSEVQEMMRVDESQSRVLDSLASFVDEELCRIRGSNAVELLASGTADLSSVADLEELFGEPHGAITELHRLICDECHGNGASPWTICEVLHEEVRRMGDPLMAEQLREQERSGAHQRRGGTIPLELTVYHRAVRAAMYPLCTTLARWVLEGTLEDPFSESPIGLNRTALSLASLVSGTTVMVAGSPYVAHLNRCPDFLRNIMPEILHCGSYVAMLAGEDEASAHMKALSGSGTTSSAFVNVRESDADRKQAREDVTRRLLDGVMHDSFDRSFTPLLSDKLTAFSSEVMRRLLDSRDLLCYLDVIETVVLGMTGLWDDFFSEHFNSVCFGDLPSDIVRRHVGYRTQARRSKQLCLSKTAGASEVAALDDQLQVVLSTLQFAVVQTSFSTVLELHVHPEPHVALVITPKSTKRLSQVFHWLSRLRWVRCYLAMRQRRALLEWRAPDSDRYLDRNVIHLMRVAHTIVGQLLVFLGTELPPAIDELCAVIGDAHQLHTNRKKRQRGGRQQVDLSAIPAMQVEDCREAFDNFTKRIAERFFLSGALNDSPVAMLIGAIEEFCVHPSPEKESDVINAMKRCAYAGQEQRVGLFLDFSRHIGLATPSPTARQR